MPYTDADWETYIEGQRKGREKRERARSVRSMPLPPWFRKVPKGFCRWCGKAAEAGRIYWHADCLGDYFLARNPAGRTDVLAKSHGRCAGCREQITHWRPQAPGCAGERVRTWEEDVADGPFTRAAREDDAWQADHVVPLWSVKREGLRWRQLIQFWLLPNLQALCEPCHKAKSAREAAERADMRRRARQPALAGL